ncbi:hypothetical protein T4B_11853 [Trichinella pseudospiralis]|uniref:Uncharacterized protein n=2 Tax=Trichinella pseudospiralis TaxID=6337 RepID=A0A0V1IPY9_TRIPS|nr:hypothetical protein T4A_8522 [Trichinella pseudospiralis]KRZ24769.1 hypothetical protein T4B_11853 [Trichinella pseudospiralis]
MFIHNIINFCTIGKLELRRRQWFSLNKILTLNLYTGVGKRLNRKEYFTSSCSAVARTGCEFNMHSLHVLVSRYLTQQAEMTKLVETIEKMTDECRNFTNNIFNVAASCMKFKRSLEQVLLEAERMHCLDECIDIESVFQPLLGLERFSCQLEEVQKIMHGCSERCWIHKEVLLKHKADADDYFNNLLCKELSKVEEAERRLEKFRDRKETEESDDRQPPTDNLLAEKLLEKFRDRVNALKCPIKLKEYFINDCLNETISLLITNLQPIQNLAVYNVITISNRMLDDQVLQDDHLDERKAQNDGCAFAPRKQKSKLNWMKRVVKGLFKRKRSKKEKEEESPEAHVELQQVYVEDMAAQNKHTDMEKASVVFPSGESLESNESEEPPQTEQNEESEREEFKWRMCRENTEFYTDEYEITEEKRYCFGIEEDEALKNESYVQRMYGNNDEDSFDSFPSNLSDLDLSVMTEEQTENVHKMIPCADSCLKELLQNYHSHNNKTIDEDYTRSEDDFKEKRNETNSSTIEDNSKFH